MAESDQKYQVPILNSTLNVIELLSKSQKGMTLSELEVQSGISKTSLFRIISTLHDREYLVKDEKSKTFSLSRKFLSLGLLALNEHNIVELAIDDMRSLRDEATETVLIGVLINNEGVVLEQIPGTQPFRFVVDYGIRFNLHSSAGGKSILSYLPKKELDDVLNNIKLTAHNENTIVEENELRNEFARVRNCGYAVDFAEETEGVHCIGAPVFNQNGYPVAAVWVTGPSGRVKQHDFDKIGQRVKYYANNISERLGFKSGEN